MNNDRPFAEIYPALRRFAGAVAGPGSDPDDLVQEAVARCFGGDLPTSLKILWGTCREW